MELERGQGVRTNGPHPAMRVGHPHPKQDVEHAGKDWVPDESVEERHGIAVDRSVEPRADDKVVTGLQPVDEGWQLLQRIRVVRIGHDEISATGALETGKIRTAVASARLGHDGRAMSRSDRGGRVRRCVVDDDDLARASRAPNALERPVDDVAHRVFLVQAGNDHRDIRRRHRRRS